MKDLASQSFTNKEKDARGRLLYIIQLRFYVSNKIVPF